MKGKTIAQETREQFNFIKREIKNGREDVIPYMSGTCNKRTRMYREAKWSKEDADIDFELGVITKDEYEFEIKAVRLLEKALANYKTY